MADAVKTSALQLSDLRDRVSRGAGPFGPVVGSAIGILWESAGLVCNVAGLGITLVSDPRQAAPKTPAPKQLPAPGASNVVPFPARRGTKPAATHRSRS
jgi:hypothetical protein